MSDTSTGRGAKSRIVIDVEKARQEAPRGRRRASGGGAGGRRVGRGAKILSVVGLVVVGLLVAAVAGGYLWWRSYRQTPAYSLALLVDAAQRDDVRAVEELLDADKVAVGFVPQVVEKLSGGAAGGANAAAIQQRADALMPQLQPRVREGVRDEVARGVKAFSEKTGGKLPFFLLAAGMSRYAEVKEEGDRATVNVSVEGRAPVELQMQRGEGRWKVVAIKDDAMASSIASRVAPGIPSNAAPQPAPTPARRPRRGR